MIVEHAPAKINLALHVTGRRADGYHLLDSLVAFAQAGDSIGLEPGPIALTLTGPFAASLDAGAGNLCLRALHHVGAQARITLDKQLPVASGLGGGSADAAAVLRALARLGHPLPAAPERMGADVPVCLGNRPARMRGIGERLEPVPALPLMAIVLANPGLPVATAAVFSALRQRDNPGLSPLPTAFTDARTLIEWLGTCRNDLEAPARAMVPAIGQVLEALRGSGAGLARLCGSGATCFGLFAGDAAAERAAARLRAAHPGWWVIATRLAAPIASDRLAGD